MGPRRLAVAAALAAVLVAGCAALPGGGRSASSSTTGPAHSVGSALGSLRIVVTDAAVRPLAGANVTFHARVAGGPFATDPAGELVLSGVEPGVYGFTVSRAGYFDSTSTAEASEGAPKPAVVVLQQDPATTPYVELSKFDGFIACSFGVPTGGVFNPCILSNNTVNELCHDANQCYDDPLGANLWYNQRFSGVASFHQVETVWSPNNAQAERMGLLAYNGTDPFNVTSYGAQSGTSPLIYVLEADDLAELHIGEGGHLLRYLWGADHDGATGSMLLQQSFQAFLTTTYRFVPPGSWTFVKDGEPVPPG